MISTYIFVGCSCCLVTASFKPTLIVISVIFITSFLIVGTLDLFVHEDLAFVEKLKKAGVQVDSFVEPGVPHSYNVILNDSPQTIRFKNLRDEAVKKML